jgi:tRNA G46 methylase TrmB
MTEQELNKKCAEILVECGYADYKTDNNNYVCWREPELDNTMEAVQLFADTLEGRQQLDVCKSYMYLKQANLWKKSAVYYPDECIADPHINDCDRIRWCIEQLENSNV